MSLPTPGADVPVVCTRSGVVMVLEAVLSVPAAREEIVRRLDTKGVKVRFSGKPCPACCIQFGPVVSPCEYRPLVGPLFVPRATSP